MEIHEHSDGKALTTHTHRLHKFGLPEIILCLEEKDKMDSTRREKIITSLIETLRSDPNEEERKGKTFVVMSLFWKECVPI